MAGPRVGVIGVGQMGRPIVDRLAAADRDPSVFVRRPELRAELEKAGISVAGSATALANSVDILVVCLFSDSQVREVLLDAGVLAAMVPDAVLVNHVTGSPALPVEIAARAPVGVRVLDTPMSGTDDQIRAGELTLLVGGDRVDLDRVESTLSTYSDPIIHVGALGDAQRIKLVNNLLFTVHVRAALEAARLGSSLGIAPAELARVIEHCSADSFALRLLQRLPPETITTTAGPYLRKDVATVRDVAASVPVDLGLLGDLARWVDEA